MPIPLYKYLEAQYAHALVTMGVLRMGTLHDFRDMERLGPRIGDADEGVRMYSLPEHLQVGPAHSPMPRFLEGVIVPPTVGEATIGNVAVAISLRNHYILCMSKAFSRAVMVECKADTCVMIPDPDRFFQALNHTMLQHCAKCVRVARVTYARRRRHHTEWTTQHEKIHPALMKDDEYSSQQEVRAIYNAEGELKPVNMICKELVGLCSIVDVPKA